MTENSDVTLANETVVWTDAMREILIKSVQRQECIWNFSNVDYRNAGKKRQIFWEIAQEMSEMFGIMLKGTHTSRQWQHLRDQYRRAKRRMEISSVNGPVKPWRFMQMLKFTDATDIAEASDPMSYLYNSFLVDDRNVQQQRPYSTPSALMSQDRKDGEQPSSYSLYSSKSDGSGLYPVTNTVTVTCSPSTAGNPYGTVEQSNETLANMERLANIERTIEAVSKAEQFNDSSYHPTGDDSAHHDVKPDANSPPVLGSKRRSSGALSMPHSVEKKAGRDMSDEFTLLGNGLGQFVEKRVRAITLRNPRLGLLVQKKINDCLFEASMELLEIEHPEVAQNNHINYTVN